MMCEGGSGGKILHETSHRQSWTGGEGRHAFSFQADSPRFCLSCHLLADDHVAGGQGRKPRAPTGVAMSSRRRRDPHPPQGGGGSSGTDGGVEAHAGSDTDLATMTSAASPDTRATCPPPRISEGCPPPPSSPAYSTVFRCSPHPPARAHRVTPRGRAPSRPAATRAARSPRRRRGGRVSCSLVVRGCYGRWPSGCLAGRCRSTVPLPGLGIGGPEPPVSDPHEAACPRHGGRRGGRGGNSPAAYGRHARLPSRAVARRPGLALCRCMRRASTSLLSDSLLLASTRGGGGWRCRGRRGAGGWPRRRGELGERRRRGRGGHRRRWTCACRGPTTARG